MPSGLNKRSSTKAGNFCFETRSTIIAARLYPLFEYEYSGAGREVEALMNDDIKCEILIDDSFAATRAGQAQN